MYLVVIKMQDGINFYCGKTKYGIARLDTWDTDINYCRIYKRKIYAKLMRSELTKSVGQARAKVRPLSKFVKDKDLEDFFKNKHKGIVL